MDLQVLALAKNYTDKQIEKAEMGDIELDQSLSKSGFAADAKIVGDKFKNLQIPTIDNTLTQEGAAADAKAVGEALKNTNTSGQIQADWEQDDETAVDFIKNRTHYKTQLDFTIIENKTVNFDVTSIGDATWAGTAEIKLEQQIPAPIAENQIVTAIINDVEWTAPVEYNSNKGILHAEIYDAGMGGRLDILFDQYNIEYPILRRIIITHEGETPFDYNNFTLSLYMSGVSVVQIPLEYIPVDQSLNHPISQQKATEMVDEVRDDIPRSYYDLNDIPCYVKESESIYLTEVYLSHNDRLKIIEGDWYMGQYTMFKIKGQLYPRKQYAKDEYGGKRLYYYCGNGALIEDTGVAELEDTGEDFVLYAFAESQGCTAYYGGDDGEYYFELYGVIPEEIKELDERCIPYTIARTADISTEIEIALTEAKESGEFDGPQGPAGNSGVYVGEEEPTDESVVVWIDLDETNVISQWRLLNQITVSEEDGLQSIVLNRDLDNSPLSCNEFYLTIENFAGISLSGEIAIPVSGGAIYINNNDTELCHFEMDTPTSGSSLIYTKKICAIDNFLLLSCDTVNRTSSRTIQQLNSPSQAFITSITIAPTQDETSITSGLIKLYGR